MLLEFLFPPVCEICEALLRSDDTLSVCTSCASSIPTLGPPHCHFCGRTSIYENRCCGQCAGANFHFDRVWAVTWYDGPMKTLIHAFKFGGQKRLKSFFVARMAEFIQKHIQWDSFEAVMPVPLEEERRLERGFNQCELLSKPLAARFGKMHLSRALVRQSWALPQSRLNKNARAANVEHCFRIADAAPVRSRNILLIDDILTTGQTASACAKALKAAGAASVRCLALARGL